MEGNLTLARSRAHRFAPGGSVSVWAERRIAEGLTARLLVAATGGGALANPGEKLEVLAVRYLGFGEEGASSRKLARAPALGLPPREFQGDLR